MQLSSTHGIGIHSGVKVLVYGRSGVGKTRLIATAPNPVIFSAEGGLLSLSQFNLPFREIKSISDLTDCWRWASQSSEANQFQTLCLDSLSEIAEVLLADSKQNVKDARQAYMEVLTRMMSLVRAFRDLPGKNVYFTAKLETSELGHHTPSMPGRKLGLELPYHFDLVFQLDIESNAQPPYRYLRTQPDFYSVAKDRSGKLQPIERPDLGYIFKTVLSTQ
jgi:AAA domain